MSRRLSTGSSSGPPRLIMKPLGMTEGRVKLGRLLPKFFPMEVVSSKVKGFGMAVARLARHARK